ncbi:M50 family metallopeptidase [Dyella choica]|uniref:M50 family peptidase n=1 Tax=Dyella choica TaxID=1927959 RepID=A0A432M1C3_9GAMM|nr:M50 family metallopeptidase [Dyella choica]RUL71067.1 M50 family peptidase [Dyella choica]
MKQEGWLAFAMELCMNWRRILVFLPLMLAALWMPKIIASFWAGQFGINDVLEFSIYRPLYWQSWFAEVFLLWLVYLWFLKGIQQRWLLHVFALIVGTVVLFIGLARIANVPPSDGFALDALGIVSAGLLAEGLMTFIRTLRSGKQTPQPGDGWRQWLVYFIQGALGVLAGITGMVVLGGAFAHTGAGVLFAGLGLFLIVALSVAIHEGGHFAGAMFTGMKVLHVRVLALELHPQRGWWLVRWAPERGRAYQGMVFAVPDPSRPMRGQILPMVAMGPLANLLAGILSVALAWMDLSPTLTSVAVAFAIVNAVMMVGNLLPRTGRVTSDGAKLLQWWKHADDKLPQLAYYRLLAHSVFGTTADALPEEDIRYLENQPMPVPLLASWYRLKAAQNRGEWGRALEVGEAFEQSVAAWGKSLPALGTLFSHMRTETAFCRAMVTGDTSALRESLLTRDAKRLSAYLWPRCLALKAHQQGLHEEARRLLSVSMREAKRSVDLALAKSETMLADHILREPVLTPFDA